MEKPIKEIKDNYPKYEELLNGNKDSSLKVVSLDEVKLNHKNTRVKKIDVLHSITKDRLELIIESKITNKKDFKFKLRAPNFTGTPFFRFDSDGLAHYNRSPEIELEKRKINTPHFHKFDSSGRNIAYKTEPLEKEKEREALLNDINLSMAHYCDESNTYYDKANYIEVIQTPIDQLDFESNRDNPTEGVVYE
ncbi:MAG: hypothetical protein ACI9EK_002920 [Psychroserpens sp.]|jgi:hypothetical protein